MNVLRKLLARGKIRAARKLLARDPSPRTYVGLAQEYVRLGLTVDAMAVCEEGLQAFVGNTLLTRLAEQTRRTERDERMAMLRLELDDAPRPALWKEMCEILVESGAFMRATESAQEWVAQDGGAEANLMLAQVLVERYFEERSRDTGLEALAALDQVDATLADDVRALELRMRFLMKIGAWRDARDTARRLLHVQPGDPDLEARYRSLEDRAGDSISAQRALVGVERTGRFADDEAGAASNATTAQVRPVLRSLVEDGDVRAALYVRGATVLMQGPKGATAERMARGVRAILSSGRATTRRLGLGQLSEIQLEGDFGTLSIAPGEADAGAIWTDGALGRERRSVLLKLAGINADLAGAES